MISLGCDVGTIATKTAILKDGVLLGSCVIPNEGKARQAVRASVDKALSMAGVPAEAIQAWGGTGSGEKYIPFPCRGKGLISCLGRAANWALPSARTLVDIGGLSSTCINLNEAGRAMEYRTSDRCASGTGFFLELAAQALELRMEELSSVAAAAAGRARISAQCAVFGESEIVTHVNDGVDAEDIMAGISHSIGSGLATMVRRLGVQPDILATGGVAKMESVLQSLGELLGVEVKRPEWDPQLAAAIGAALCAAEE
jgi:predicted CoA-substrate-specific enzyme activase